MGAATQVTDFSDLYTDLLNRVRDATGVTATTNIAKRFINQALEDMHIGTAESFPWAERRTQLITQAKYTTGTLSVSKGDTALTGSSTAWATNNDFGVNNMRAGGKILINGGNEPYRILSVTDDTNATLAWDWVESDASAVSYIYYEDEYALATDFGRPLDWRSFSDGYDIPIIGRTDFRRHYPRNHVPGKIRVATIIDDDFSSNTTPVRKVMFHNPPEDAQVIPYSYITRYLAVQSDGTRAASLSSDTDEPIVPLRYRHAIVFHALYHWYRDRKDDTRAQEAKAEYVDIMMRVMSDVEVGGRRPKLRPRIGPYWAKARRPWSGSSSRRYDIYDRFDRMEW